VGLRNKLRVVERYFAAASYGRAKVELHLATRSGPVRIAPELAQPDAPLAVRRRELLRLLAERQGLDGVARALVVTHTRIWPFVLPHPITELPQLESVGWVGLDTDWGTLAHEVGHLLGLPDLHDQRLADRGLQSASAFGPWCLMSRSKRRPDLCAWSKLQLGWILPAEVAVVRRGEERTVLLDALSAPRGHCLVVKAVVAENRYYLVENRQLDALDRRLPAAGVLITRVDFFAAEPADRIRVVDAGPRTGSLDDAVFTATPGRDAFRDEINGIEIRVEQTRGERWYRIHVKNS
jgi:hypothetical protein